MKEQIEELIQWLTEESDKSAKESAAKPTTNASHYQSGKSIAYAIAASKLKGIIK